jgi:ferrochelatase
MTESPPIGVLIMAYGGPTALTDVPGYLADIRSGRPTPKHVVDEITRNYRSIGGSSPLLERTLQQGRSISRALEETGKRFRIYHGMRHWAPWIEDAVGAMLEDGIERAVSVVLAPQYSSLSIARYQAKIEDGMAMYRGTIDFRHIRSYHDSPGLIESLAARVHDGLSRWDATTRDKVHVVFSAHSLPVRIIAAGDPYDMQARQTARLVAAHAGIPDDRWSWSYQSAGRSDEEWLGPALRDHLLSLAGQGILDVVIVPVGFVSDHVEILYDIDVDARELATGIGMRLERPPALNDEPRFMRDLAGLIHDTALEASWA